MKQQLINLVSEAWFIETGEMTNGQLRKIIEKIEVDHEGNVDIFMKLTERLNLARTVPISGCLTYGSNKIERFLWVIGEGGKHMLSAFFRFICVVVVKCFELRKRKDFSLL